MALCGEKPGEYINPMTNETKPINECDIMPQLCKPGSCHDTPTGFQCGCDHGYVFIPLLVTFIYFEGVLISARLHLRKHIILSVRLPNVTVVFIFKLRA